MATSNDITLTKALYGITKTTAKLSFIFFILAAILVSVTINAGDPNINTYTLHDQEENFLYGFYVSEGDSEVQIGFVIINDDNMVDSVEFKVQKVTADGGQVLENIITTRSHDFFRELSLEPGHYKVYATSFGETVEIASGYGSLNLVLVGLSILAIVIALICIGIFFAVLPFTVFVLILNTFNKDQKQRYVQPKQRGQTDTAQQSQSVRQPQIVQSSPSQPKSTPFSFDPESFAAKLTTKDWAWLAIALVSFIGFVFDPDSPYLFFSIIIVIVIIYSVSEREKTKLRILNLLNTYNETSVDFLRVQLDKKIKYTIKVLQVMILDDAMPIRLDMETLKVTVVGSLTPFIPQREYDEPKVATQEKEYYSPEPQSQSLSTSEIGSTVQDTMLEAPPADMHCTACGEGLIGRPKYCYICGQKTI